MQPSMSIRRADLMTLGVRDWRIEFIDANKVMAGFARILTGWDVAVTAPTPYQSPPDVRIARTAAGFRWSSTSLTKPVQWRTRAPRTTMGAICEVHDALFDWLLAANPGWLCLHAAAARIANRLVCFPSVGKAGKSTLMIELAMRGHQVFCDDVLAIGSEFDRALGLGIAPRLRRPLPAGVGRNFEAFLAERRGPSDRRWAYACLGEGEIAPFGTEAPIAMLVLLARDDRRARARLVPIGRAEMLRELILQDFADAVPAAEKLDRLIAIVEHAECYRLHYARGSDAARALETQLGRKPLPADEDAHT